MLIRLSDIWTLACAIARRYVRGIRAPVFFGGGIFKDFLKSRFWPNDLRSGEPRRGDWKIAQPENSAGHGRHPTGERLVGTGMKI